MAAIETSLPEIGAERGLGYTFTPGSARKARRRHAGPEGARQDARRTPRQRLLPLCPAPAGARREGGAACLADGRARLAGIVEKLEAVSDWTAAGVEAVVREHAEAIGVKLGQVAQPLRAALTGRATSPGLFDVMAVLGRDETLSRLRDQLSAASAA